MIQVLIFCLILPLILIGVALYSSNKVKNKKSYWKDYIHTKEEVFNELEENRKQLVEMEKEEIQYQISSFLKEAELKRESIQEQLKQLDNDLAAARERRDNQLTELANTLASEIEKQSKEEALQLQSIVDYYEQQKVNIAEEFHNYTEDMRNKKAELEKEIKFAEQKQLEIIEEFKRAEQIKEDKNFYRIVLSENDIEDVRKLRKVADELHDPSVLYKLIYKTYYERPFTEMVGRVVTGRGNTGIYKITNIENGKIYIGQTKQAFKERWRTHLKRGVKAEPGTQNKLYAAMWEDGAENFTFEVLSECDTTELNVKEREYIAFYHANTWGYNSTGGNS